MIDRADAKPNWSGFVLRNRRWVPAGFFILQFLSGPCFYGQCWFPCSGCHSLSGGHDAAQGDRAFGAGRGLCDGTDLGCFTGLRRKIL